MAKKILKEKANTVCDTLERLYPQAVCSLVYSTPYELLIATRLSAQCTDARVNVVTKELFSRYPTLESIAGAKLEDIEKIVHPCGLYKTKAKDILSIANDLINRFGGEVPATMEDLTSLSGVGRKTANLILGDIYHKPAIVCDTHCIRITNRLGLSDTKDPYKCELQLKEVLDPERSSDLCHRLVLFGRDVCTARSPKCDECPFDCKMRGK